MQGLPDSDLDFSFKQLFVPLTNAKAITWIIVIGLIVFANMLFNGFVWDDNTYIQLNPSFHSSLSFLDFFRQNLFNTAGQYRPIPELYFYTLYKLFGAQSFYYHSIQLALHITDGILVYFLFKRFFTQTLSLFLSLVFLIHPIQVESVSYIGAVQSELYFLPGIIALLLSQKIHLSRGRLLLIITLLFFSLLTKETGIYFLLLVPMYRYLFKLPGLKKFFLSEVIIIIIYFFLRIFVGRVGLSSHDAIPLVFLSISQRILNIPIIFTYYLKTFFFPIHLAVWQLWVIRDITIQNFFIPLVICLLFVSGWFFLFKKIKRISQHQLNETKLQQFFFFSFWFFIGIGPFLQIIPLDMTVADRWFYFPIVGLLGMLVNCFQLYHVKGKQKALIVTGMVIVLCILSLRTFVRNMDWHDEIRLFTHDSAVEDNFELENVLGVDLASEGDSVRALQRFQRSVSLVPMETNLTNLAILEAITQNYSAAEKYFTIVYNKKGSNSYFPHKNGTLLFYNNYSKFLILTNNATLADHIIMQGLNEYPTSADLWAFEALQQYKEGHLYQATQAANKMYSINPNNPYFYIYSHIIAKEPVTFTAFGQTYTFSFGQNE